MLIPEGFDGQKQKGEKVWKRVTYGGDQRDGAALLAMLERNGVAVDDLARQCVAGVLTAQVRTSVGLVRRTGWELGFSDPATFNEIVVRVKRLSTLVLCPAQAAVQLRSEWLDQEAGDVWVLMEPVAVGAHLRVFRLSRDESGLHLDTETVSCAYMGHKWDPSAVWIIAARQPSA